MDASIIEHIEEIIRTSLRQETLKFECNLINKRLSFKQPQQTNQVRFVKIKPRFTSLNQYLSYQQKTHKKKLTKKNKNKKRQSTQKQQTPQQQVANNLNNQQQQQQQDQKAKSPPAQLMQQQSSLQSQSQPQQQRPQQHQQQQHYLPNHASIQSQSLKDAHLPNGSTIGSPPLSSPSSSHSPSRKSQQHKHVQASLVDQSPSNETAKLIDSTLQSISAAHMRNAFHDKRLLVNLIRVAGLSRTSAFFFSKCIYRVLLEIVIQRWFEMLQSVKSPTVWSSSIIPCRSISPTSTRIWACSTNSLCSTWYLAPRSSLLAYSIALRTMEVRFT